MPFGHGETRLGATGESTSLLMGRGPVTYGHFMDPSSDLVFEQYYLACLSQASYLIGDRATGRAVVVDPQPDVGA